MTTDAPNTTAITMAPPPPTDAITPNTDTTVVVADVTVAAAATARKPKHHHRSKVGEAMVSATKKKHKKANHKSYASYIYKVLRQIHPELGISKTGMAIMDSFVHDIFGKMGHEAGQLAKHAGKHTISAREIQTAAKLIIPGELGKHSIAEGTKAVTKFMSCNSVSSTTTSSS